VTGGSGHLLLPLALGGTLVFVWAGTALILRALAHEAEVARLQSDFVAAVSHEFRSPLTAMRQMAEMLDSERVPDESRRKHYYRILAGEAARLQRLVESLLDFGRMEAGRPLAARTRIDLDALVHSVVDEVRRQPRAASARIDVVPPDRAVPLKGDPDGLRLALRNLVENAVKYSPGGAHVTVCWGVDGESAVMAVTDRGLGIAPHEHARIFGKFVRGESAATAHVGGTGVGLAVVQQVVRAHHGEVRLESRPGEGSTFTIRLPLGAAPGAET
jgi:signal transduction histidine kinase